MSSKYNFVLSFARAAEELNPDHTQTNGYDSDLKLSESGPNHVLSLESPANRQREKENYGRDISFSRRREEAMERLHGRGSQTVSLRIDGLRLPTRSFSTPELVLVFSDVAGALSLLFLFFYYFY